MANTAAIWPGTKFGYTLYDERERLSVLFNRAGAPVDMEVLPNGGNVETLLQSGLEAGRLLPGGYVIRRISA